ncbi:Gfo/Idh/MocA family protein [Chromobacterium haemolyticum]|uniref:Gfo/Idh/MocA family protein n=1 Tax=Chromobacterium haemolyticum TaxID=394935 RepID=UPI0019625B44|nr:Gfo/Idh/MocA family oxidoreductase [Chromobacterium haemolyticum]
MSTLNLGVAGLGRLGRRHALNLRDRIAGARVIGVCSPLREELGWARRELPDAAGHAALEGLLAEPGLDAVLLATPTALHAEQIIACLDAGKHVSAKNRWR